MKHHSIKNYEILLPPFPLEFDDWTRKEADYYLNWFVTHIRERAAYVLQKSIGITLPDNTIPAEVLIDVWQWFLQNAEIEYTSPQEVAHQRQQFGYLGESFVNETRLSTRTEYIIRDIAMLVGAVFKTNYPTLYWGYDNKPKRYIFINQPVLKGFLNTRYGKPFADVFQPVHMVSVQAAKYLSNDAHECDLFNLYQHWKQHIP